MKNFERDYLVEGTAALDIECLSNIIELPGRVHVGSEEAETQEEKSSGFFANMNYESLEGKAFNLAKPWQSWFVGICFLGFALACVFLKPLVF